jgi:dynein heavy chain
VLKFELFNTRPTKVLKPEEFEQLQMQAISYVSQQLKDVWLLSLKNGIKNSLKEVGKGWFNLNEKRQEVYEISKLKKFMTMINFMMEDTLRFLVQASADKYTQFVEAAANYAVTVHGISSVDVVYRGVDQAKRPPLFVLDLTAKDGEIVLNFSQVGTEWTLRTPAVPPRLHCRAALLHGRAS